jgi:hypothetical protein
MHGCMAKIQDSAQSIALHNRNMALLAEGIKISAKRSMVADLAELRLTPLSTVTQDVDGRRGVVALGRKRK